jgi:glycosyltransferase involved in cell wall biosynthesis
MMAVRSEGVPEGTEDRPELVSVVMNFLNAEAFLEHAIGSVYAQSYASWELLLIDDGSTDGSTRIALHHAARDPGRVRYLEHPGHLNHGSSVARNLGIAEARGDFIAFLDADDVWLPERLSRSIELLRKNPGADMVYGQSEYWFGWAGDGARFPDRVQPHWFPGDRVVPAPELLIGYLTHRAALPCPTSITLRRSAALASGGFVESFRAMHEDQAFLARFCLHHDVYVADQCWDRYRQHDSSMCASVGHQGRHEEAQGIYLAWLRDFLVQQQTKNQRLWAALRYAERMHHYGHGSWWARLARRTLKTWMRAKVTFASGSLY